MSAIDGLGEPTTPTAESRATARALIWSDDQKVYQKIGFLHQQTLLLILTTIYFAAWLSMSICSSSR
jgi:hypothetical protein